MTNFRLPFADLPSDIVHALRGRNWSAVQIGMSRASVFRFDGGLYLKSIALAPNDAYYGNLRGEKARLEWLQGKVRVPEVVAFATDTERDYLVATEIPGQNATTTNRSAGAEHRAIESIAEACRHWHSIGAAHCPFVATSQSLLDDAQLRLDTGLVDVSDFDEERQGRDPRELLTELRALRPDTDDLVLTHGDFCLPNIILQGGHVSGFVDVGRAARADRWHDLALCARSMASNWGAQAASRLLSAYGAPEDAAKREFYVLLDEFF